METNRPSPEAVITLVAIDDNQHSLELLAAALSQDGLEILTATNPQEGLDLVHSRHPQIVLTDLVMPRMSGMEVLERVVEFDPSIDVILMTAHYSTESAVEAIRKGASDSASWWRKRGAGGARFNSKMSFSPDASSRAWSAPVR